MNKVSRLAALLLAVLLFAFAGCALAEEGGDVVYPGGTEMNFSNDEINDAVSEAISNLYNTLLSLTTLQDMYDNMFTNTNWELLNAMNAEQLQGLYNHANDIFYAIENPTEDEIDLHRDITDTFLIIAEGMEISLLASTIWTGTQTITLTSNIEGSQCVVKNGANITLDLNGYTIDRKSNPANGQGSAVISIEKGGKLTINDSAGGGKITGGWGTLAGGILNSGTLIMNGGTITGNVVYGRLYTKVDDNTINQTSQKYTLTDESALEKTENITTTIKIPNTNVNATGRNYVWGLGGGVYIASTGNFTMNGGSITENIAAISGGGVFANGPFIMNGGMISKNEAAVRYGGGVYINNDLDYIPVDFDYTPNGSFTMNNGTISENKASSGAGVMVWEEAVFEMNNGTISENYADGGNSPQNLGNGGAIYVQTGEFYFKGGLLTKNKAHRYGGAININQSAKIYLEKGTISYNEANYGGGISQEAGDCAITLSNDNLIIEYNEANNDGGGLFIEKGTLDIKAGIVRNNKAGVDPNDRGHNAGTKGNGGGISLCVKRIAGDITVNMTGGTITGNTAGGIGGGIGITADYDDGTNSNDVVVNLIGGTISQNTATGDGGGVCVSVNENNSTAVVNVGNENQGTATVLNNSAANGGGVAVLKGAVNIYNGTLEGNTASANGGAVYVTGGNDVKMYGGKIQGGSKTNAKNGGAVYVDEGNFEMSDGEITGNTASVNGGAVYLAGGNFTMFHGIINSNNAVDGGAVYMKGDSSTKFVMQSGQMNENKASEDGGAIYATAGTLNIGLEKCTHANSLHTSGKYHPQIQKNEAAQRGGGIMIEGQGTVNFYCGDAIENEALYKGVGMNVFMQGGTFNIYEGGNIASLKDPELVIMGGTLNNYTEEADKAVKIYYYDSNKAYNEQNTCSGQGTLNAHMNLPSGEYFWTAPEGMRFIGWTPYGPDSPDIREVVRNKDEYKPSGVGVEIIDEAKNSDGDNQGTYDGKSDQMMHLYALWAPEKSSITYVDGMTYAVVPDYQPDEYTFDEATMSNIIIPAIQKDGYAVVGWYIYQNEMTADGSEKQNANWGYEPVYVSGTEEADKDYNKLDYGKLHYQAVDNVPGSNMTLNVGDMRFGDITLIAKFEPQYGTLKLKKNVSNDLDTNASFLFHITGTPDNDALGYDEDNPYSVYVTVNGIGTTTIEEIPVGNYTVTEVEAWSWRYGAGNASVDVEIKDPTIDYQAEFTNTRGKTKWLDGENFKENLFDGDADSTNEGKN